MNNLKVTRLARFSVLIVTYNRLNDLVKAVQSVLNQTTPPFEVIVIDDCSTNPVKLKEHKGKIRVIRNNLERGLSASRNIGVKVAKGEYIAFLDDDATADKHWLRELKRSLDLGYDIVGGALEPHYFTKPPSWWDEKVLGGTAAVGNKYAVKRSGKPMSGVWGCNFAVRKDVFRKIGYFREDLGRYRGKLLSGEETEFKLRAQKAGMKIAFNEKAIVFHKVYPYRLVLSYLFKRGWYEGVSERRLYGFTLKYAFTKIRATTRKFIYSRSKASLIASILTLFSTIAYITTKSSRNSKLL